MYTFYFCAIFFFSISRIFYIHHSSIRSLFFISHFFFFYPSLIDQGLLHFANIIHLSIDQGFSRSNILHSSFHRSGLFFAFREYHTSIFSLIRAFCISRISYIHPFIDQGFFCTFLDLFIHFFLCASIFLHFGH